MSNSETILSKEKKEMMVCTPINAYPANASRKTRAKWLRDHSGDLCVPDLYINVFNAHLVHPDDVGVLTGYYERNWASLEAYLFDFKPYEKYVYFEHSAGQITNLGLYSFYKEAVPCYSVAFFRGIKHMLNPLPGTMVKFSFAEVRTKGNTIVVSIEYPTGTTTYFDYSDEPKKKSRDKIGGTNPF